MEALARNWLKSSLVNLSEFITQRCFYGGLLLKGFSHITILLPIDLT